MKTSNLVTWEKNIIKLSVVDIFIIVLICFSSHTFLFAPFPGLSLLLLLLLLLLFHMLLLALVNRSISISSNRFTQPRRFVRFFTPSHVQGKIKVTVKLISPVRWFTGLVLPWSYGMNSISPADHQGRYSAFSIILISVFVFDCR